MRFFWGLFLACLSAQAADVIDTDLGVEGNRMVAQTFERYRKDAVGCLPSGQSERRILVQGFGPFSGIDRNLSGAVVAKLAGLDVPPQTKNGGWTSTRRLTVDGETIEFCFVYLDVVWDLAGAILLTEIERFDPELVMLSGVGSSVTIAEGGAQNRALGLSGFDSAGNPIKETNTPWCGSQPCGYWDHTYVLSPKDDGVEAKVTHSWNNVAFSESLRQSLQGVAPQFFVEAPKEAREGNDYLCNNVAYLVQSAINGAEIKLAGGAIMFSKRQSKRAAGFLHYQSDPNPTPERIALWASAVATALKRMPRSDFSREL